MFPKELPQPFNSIKYGEVVSENYGNLPSKFTANSKGKFKPVARAGRHNLARPGKLRRQLSLVNPVRYFNLANEIVQNWQDIKKEINKESISSTKPMIDITGERAISGECDIGERFQLRAEYRSNSRYILKADIEKCYQRIYTHSIAWAIHGKETAKRNTRNNSLLGNRLDRKVCLLQDRQTNGIPIGPDTSLVLAEIVLGKIDQNLRTKLPAMRGFRYIDDYELHFDKLYEAEESLSILQQELNRYGFQLSDEKTEIKELPLGIVTPWVRPLREFEIRSKRKLKDTIDFFSLAFRLSNDNPRQSVLRYAIAKTGSETYSSSKFETYQNLLLQCISSEAGTIMYALSELLFYYRRGYSIQKKKVGGIIENIVNQDALHGHASEVAWAVWMAINLDIDLSKASVDLAKKVDDPVIPIVLLHARSKGLTPSSFKGDTWCDVMEPRELYGPNWLLAYEANIKGWLPSNSKNDHVDARSEFKWLKDNNVSFYNEDADGRYVETWKSNADLIRRRVMGY
jgi:hypothetical protein